MANDNMYDEQPVQDLYSRFSNPGRMGEIDEDTIPAEQQAEIADATRRVVKPSSWYLTVRK